MSTLPPTLLSAVHNSKADDALTSRVTHPFATSSETTCGLLQDIIRATDQVTSSLNQYVATTFTSQKLVSTFRQQAAIEHSLHLSEQNVHQTVNALRKRSTTEYGEDIPLNKAEVVDWCISRLEEWGKEVGMETFRDEKEEGIGLVFGGKVLVIDLELSIARTESSVHISRVKTTYAASSSTSESSTMDGSSSLDTYLKSSVERFLTEVQKAEDVRNPVDAARYGKTVLDDLRYLVMLDKLAERKGDGGVKWFVDVDHLSIVVEGVSKNEALAIASSLNASRPPLDIFLLRSHALPLPYLSSPSLSFLVHISPLVYLTCLRKFAEDLPSDAADSFQLDVSLTKLRSYLSERPKGATLCTLVLSQPIETHLFEPSMSMPHLTSRPTFPLTEGISDLEHVFPQLDLSASPLDSPIESSGRNIWMLDFTADGKSPGVVMSQSRMRDVELVINPLSMETLNPVGMLSFGAGSWVDLLLNPSSPISPECYTALYTSPTSVHPPLQLRLTAPEEPGFILEKVPVHSMKEVWGVLEVIREQCWLNETLLSCQWSPEGIKLNSTETPSAKEPEVEVTEDVLQSVLQGTLPPRKIPVNVFIPDSSADPIFESTGLDTITKKKPKIIMSSPERPPISGLVAITVTYDEGRPRGVGVDVSGAMGADLKSDILEEICRRGGTLSLPGRVWVKSDA